MTFTIEYHDRFESRTEHVTVEAESIEAAVAAWIDDGGAGWIDVLAVRAEPETPAARLVRTYSETDWDALEAAADHDAASDQDLFPPGA